MIKARHLEKSNQLKEKLLQHSQTIRQLSGLNSEDKFVCFSAQLIDSLRRIEFAIHLRESKLNAKKAIPWSGYFDPLAAAVLHNREGRMAESWWLVLLATHFGKHAADRWLLTEAVYGKLNQGGIWDWSTVSNDSRGYGDWHRLNFAALKRSGRFSNHRKYESLDPNSKAGTITVVETYVAWVLKHGSPSELIRKLHKIVGQNPKEVFNALYKEMDQVNRFGRLGKFDFLTMLGKLHLAPIEPGLAYLSESTGPKKGARLLFLNSLTDNKSDKFLDDWLTELDGTLNVGMQALEDAMCNWQKSPSKHIYFRG